MNKQVDWATVSIVVEDLFEGQMYVEEAYYTDGTALTADECDELYYANSDKCYEIAYDNYVAAAEYIYEGER